MARSLILCLLMACTTKSKHVTVDNAPPNLGPTFGPVLNVSTGQLGMGLQLSPGSPIYMDMSTGQLHIGVGL